MSTRQLFRENLFLLAFLLISAFNLNGQKGVLKGAIVDKGSGETLIGATVALVNGSEILTGTATDFDGTYTLDIEPGVYNIEISYTSYTKQLITGVEIKPNEANILDVALEPEAQQLEQVVVTATAVKNTEVALLALQRKALSIQEGMSSQQIGRTGSSNAADAMRQMTGAVVEGGRFIVMRGLGDRYSISQLNGITLPSTDPYRNSTSLDLIPSQMIDNIITTKTFTPELPGNFTGGLVNINTKTFPDKFNLYLSVGSEYNTQASLIDNFNAMPEKGKNDWLGLDDGSRDQPALLLDPSVRNQLSSSTYLTARTPGNEEVTNIFNQSSKSLSNQFVPLKADSKLNTSVNFSLGNRFKFLGNDLGFTMAVNYGNNYNHYNDGQVNTWINTSSTDLFDYQALRETRSVQNPSLGALFNVAYKLGENHAITGNIIFNNDAEFIARQQSGRFLGQVSNSLAEFNTNSLEFIQRQVTTYQIGGKHVFPRLGKTEIEWQAAQTKSFQDEPDLRYFAYTKVTENEEPEYAINNAEFAFPYHFFRYLEDNQTQAKVDISVPFLTRGREGSSNKLKFGAYYSTADRSFEEYRYQLNNTGVPSDRSFGTYKGDLNAFWDYQNFGIIDTTYKTDGSIQRYVTGYHYINQINAKNFYTGEQTIAAGYLMLVQNLTDKLKAIGGVRVETTDISVVSQDPNTPEGKIDQSDLLYSLNLIYTLTEKSSLRGAVTRTLARPNMRELAPFEQFDTKNGFFNVGNPNLTRTLINNYDLRYELYPRSGELIALSVFYKSFQDPIIRAFNPRATIPELSYINVDEAEVYGVELELRKNLSFITPALEHFYFSANLALIESSYPIPADELANHQSIDPTYDQTERPFQGQAPFVVNGILSYINPDKGWESSISYNLSGSKLYNIALFGTPDVYEAQFPLMNFKVSKRFVNRYQISFTARNILNPMNKKTQDYKGREYIAESYQLGTSLGLSLAYIIK